MSRAGWRPQWDCVGWKGSGENEIPHRGQDDRGSQKGEKPVVHAQLGANIRKLLFQDQVLLGETSVQGGVKVLFCGQLPASIKGRPTRS